MGYRSEIALQFPSEEIADKFIAHYEARMAELVEKPNWPFLIETDGYNKDNLKNYSMFSRASKTILIGGSVVYYWSEFKFYNYFPEVHAMTDVLETNEYSAIFIRIGEDAGDVVNEAYDSGWYDIDNQISWIQQIDIPK